MAATLKAFTLLIICIADLIASSELETLPYHVVYACQGKIVNLPWVLSMDLGREEVNNVQWYFLGGGKKDLVAKYSHGQFRSSWKYADRAIDYQRFGLTLFDVRSMDTGNYSVEAVTKRRHPTASVPVSHSYTVYLQVSDDLMVRRDRLAVTQDLEASWDTTLKRWTIRLLCGIFTFQGQPPIQVEWILPSGMVRGSNGYKEGWFYLSLTLPSALAGKYTCSIPRQFYRKVCLPPRMENVFPSYTEASTILEKVKIQEALASAERKKLLEDKTRQDIGNEVTEIQHLLQKENTKGQAKTKTQAIHNELKKVQRLLENVNLPEDMKSLLQRMQLTLKKELTKDMGTEASKTTQRPVFIKDMGTEARKTTQKPVFIKDMGTEASKTTQKPGFIKDMGTEARKTTQKPVFIKDMGTEASKTTRKPVFIEDMGTEARKTTQKPVFIKNEETEASTTTHKPDIEDRGTEASKTTQKPDIENMKNELKKIQQLIQQEFLSKEAMKDELKQVQTLLQKEYSYKQDMKKQLKRVQDKLTEEYTNKEDMDNVLKHVQRTLREGHNASKEAMKNELKQIQAELRKTYSKPDKTKEMIPMIPKNENDSTTQEIKNEITKIQKLLKEQFTSREELRNELKQIQKLLKAEYASKKDLKKEIDDVEKELKEQYTTKQDMKSFVDQIQKTLREEQASSTEDMKQMLKQMEQTLRKDFSLSKKGLDTEIKNVALHRPAVQSSTYKKYGYANYAGLAVDGNRDSDFKKGSCIYTRHQHNARSWWQVDLGLLYDIISVVITNRGDGDGSKLRNFDVSVYHRNPIDNPSGRAVVICYHHTGAMKQGATENFPCNNGPIKGRFVRLTNSAGNPLHVCEVEVMAKTKI